LIRLNERGQLASGEWCINYMPTTNPNENHFGMAWCEQGTVDGPWSFDENSGLLKNTHENKCVVIDRKTLKLVLAECDKNNKLHRWNYNALKPKWHKNF